LALSLLDNRNIKVKNLGLLYFQSKMAGVNINNLQKAILLGFGLQNKTLDQNKVAVKHAKFEEQLLRGEQPLYNKFDYDLTKPVELSTEDDIKDLKNNKFTNRQHQRLQKVIQNKRLPQSVSNKLPALKKTGNFAMPINWVARCEFVESS
jgi:Possible tRNA binding domain